jgi:hypothetical protein
MNVHDLEFRERNLAFIDYKQAKGLDGVTLQEDEKHHRGFCCQMLRFSKRIFAS